MWEDDNSDDGYVLVKQEDAAHGLAFFIATYILSLKKTKVGLFNVCTPIILSITFFFPVPLGFGYDFTEQSLLSIVHMNIIFEEPSFPSISCISFQHE